MPKSKPRARVHSNLESRLANYALVATAAGLTLATAAPSQAKVVYTATTVDLGGGSMLDVDGDGVTDFTFGFGDGVHSSIFAVHAAVAGNAVLCLPTVTGCFDAAPGIYGRPVGPKRKFVSNTITSFSFTGGGVEMAVAAAYGSKTYFFGPWAGLKNRYLGMKFLISGQVHYGWARITVGNWLKGKKIVLTGYAYETKANTRILQGQESGTAPTYDAQSGLTPSAAPASLGWLARGSDGLAVWRREQD
ncbi:MAG TPA: hypothetical protein VMH04_21240 [Candidatus Solibacter sp.]|nr:hypothetical protein [Candidatus Solibacter sp.]